MTDARARQIERIVDAVASAILALALFVAVEKFGFGLALGVAGALVCGGLCWRALGSIEPKAARFDVPDFQLVGIAQEELLLSEADRVGPPAELMLDDIAAHVGSGSRVVRLFDPAAMPTAGELGARIDRHLHLQGSAGVADASQELFDALAQLRRSLR